VGLPRFTPILLRRACQIHQGHLHFLISQSSPQSKPHLRWTYRQLPQFHSNPHLHHLCREILGILKHRRRAMLRMQTPHRSQNSIRSRQGRPPTWCRREFSAQVTPLITMTWALALVPTRSPVLGTARPGHSTPPKGQALLIQQSHRPAGLQRLCSHGLFFRRRTQVQGPPRPKRHLPVLTVPLARSPWLPTLM